MLKQLFVMMSLSLAVPGCQTTPDPAADQPMTKAEELLDSQLSLARNALDTGKPQQAMQALRPLLQTHPKSAAVHGLMGLTQLALKNPGRAVHHLQTAYKLDKRTSTGLNLSAAYIEAGEYEKAAALLKSLRPVAKAESYASPERILHNLGIVATKQKHFVQAEEWFRAALEENPTYHITHLELARLYERSRRPAMAIKAYRAAADFCQACYEPVEALSNIYMRSGRHADARLVLARYVSSTAVTDADKARARELLKLSTASGPKDRANLR